MTQLVWRFPVLALLVTSCVPGLDVADNALITCARTADCPPQSICNPSTNLCVSSDSPDLVPPSIVTATLTPSVASPSTTILLDIEVNEPLRVAPKVELLGTSTPQPFELVGQADATHYTLALPPHESHREGIDYPVLVTLADTAGNTASEELADTLRYDLTGPVPIGLDIELVPQGSTPLGVVGSLLGNNLLGSLTVAGPGTVIEVSFELSEPVLDAADLQEVAVTFGGSTTTQFVPDQVINGRYFFSHVTTNEPSGTFVLTITTVDDIGNVHVDTQHSIIIDQAAPNPVDVDTPNRVVYQRIPHGSASTGGEATFNVTAQSGAATGAAFVLALDAPTFQGTGLGAAVVDNSGAFALTLSSQDRRDVYLIALDEAGNASLPRRVRQTRLVNTMGLKVPYSKVENPNVMWSTPRFDASREQAAANELGAADGVATQDCPGCRSGLASVNGLGYWRTPVADKPSGSPSATFVPADYMAVGYDPITQRVLAFGGFYSGLPSLRATWAFDGTDWTMVTAGGPSARRNARMAVDGNLNKLLLFGGQYTSLDTACAGGNFYCNDVWQWNGSSWSTLATTGTPPTQRASFGMAFDSVRDRMVVFGGNDINGKSATTHELNCNSVPCTWTAVGGTAPSARADMGMTFDEANGRIVLLGGETASSALSDLWYRTGTSWSLAAANVGQTNVDHWLTYDSSRREVLSWGLPWSVTASGTACQRPPMVSTSGFMCPPFLFGTAPLQAGQSYAIVNPSSNDVVVFSATFDPGRTYRFNGGAADRPAQGIEVALGTSLGGGTSSLRAHIDFTSEISPSVPGLLRDTGEALGSRPSGHTYGWTCSEALPGYTGPIPIRAAAGADAAPEQVSYVLAQYSLQFAAAYSCSWAFDLPNGIYNIMIWLRDADDWGVDSGFVVEGETLVVEQNGPSNVVTFARQVTITDGQLNIAPHDPDSLDGVDPDTAIAALAIYDVTPLQELSVRWWAQSSSSAPGTTLYGWDGTMWQPLVAEDSAAAEPIQISWTASSEAEAARYIRDATRTLTFAVAPTGTNGTNSASVVTDYVEVETHFTLSP